MRFNIANKAPVVVKVNGADYALKRIRRPFWVRWSAEIDGRRTEEATGGLSPIERSKLLLIYPIEPTMHSDLARRIYTTEGTGRIIKEAAKTGSPEMPDDVLANWLDETDERDLETLALILASVIDHAEQLEKTKDETEGNGSPEGPLASTPAA